ncbi:MAG TPA: glutamine synthetase type III, partial [Smithella sp.]|nr:glutamine synthetase type III [Smithella sp.]
RLGANEAPPAIISVFLGEKLTQILENIQRGKVTKATNADLIDLGIFSLPTLSKDNTDRNRTSPFAFTGDKFEFRAVGSSQNISFPAMVINTIVAESLDELAEKIKTKNSKNINQAVLEVLKEEISYSKAVLFNGDNYSREWEIEAARRGLPNEKTTPTALKALTTVKALNLFEKYQVLSNPELKSRQLIHVDRYIKDLEIEVKCLNTLCTSQIIPAAVVYQKKLADAINSTRQALGNAASVTAEIELLKKITDLINSIHATNKEIQVKIEAANALHDEQKKAEMLSARVKPMMEELREYADALEILVDDDIWPVPKFWEMLFIS